MLRRQLNDGAGLAGDTNRVDPSISVQRQHAGCGGIFHARKLGQSTHRLTIKRGTRLPVGIGLMGQINGRCHDVPGLKTAVYMQQLKQTGGHEAGHQHQSHANGNFHGNQHSAHPLAAARLAGQPRLAVQHLLRPGAGNHPRGSHTRQQGRQRGKQKSKAGAGPVQMQRPAEIQGKRKIMLHDRHKKSCQQKAQRAAQSRQQRRFTHGHAQQLGAAGPKSGGDGDLLTPPCRARQQQIGDVDAADQQQSRHRRKENQKRLAIVAHQRLLEGRQHSGERALFIRG